MVGLEPGGNLAGQRPGPQEVRLLMARLRTPYTPVPEDRLWLMRVASSSEGKSPGGMWLEAPSPVGAPLNEGMPWEVE